MSLRVGIAGYGIVGTTRHRVLYQHEAFDVVAISDINFKESPTDLDNINTYCDYKDLINTEDLDVLFVSVPNKLVNVYTMNLSFCCLTGNLRAGLSIATCAHFIIAQ